jgi:folate-binding protein YgfZ
MSIEPNCSPVHGLHEQREAFFLPYGNETSVSSVVETFGDLDMEYAALRKGSVIFDENHMGTIEIRGQERLGFLNNMLTAKVVDQQPGESRWSFWLSRKGRIDADLRLAETSERMLVRVDRHLAAQTASSLESFVFAEDVEIKNASDQWHRFALHGPTSLQWVSQLAGNDIDLDSAQNRVFEFQGQSLVLERYDLCAEIGLSLIVPIGIASVVYERLLAIAEEHPKLKARPSGWMAINAARIEAGNPVFNLDFGDSNLPAETGIIDKRVNFTKGCYLGQEVVARMHARGQCARRVGAVRIEDQQITPEQTEICQPTTGSQVFEVGKEAETPVGVVTSSTISPMLGAIPIAFAMIKSGSVSPGTELSISAEGQLVRGIVQEKLAFWSKNHEPAER